MDGNGRWAEKRGLPRVEGHRLGVEAVNGVVECCVQKKIPVLSLFAFSSENWARPIDEVEFLMQLFVSALARELEKLHSNGVQLRFTGDRSQLSPALLKEMRSSESLTSANTQLTLNIVLNYGGKWDIVQATRTIARLVAAGEIVAEDIDETFFAKALNTHGMPDPDLFIRTSGEKRISNFFLWQLAYTELYFSEVHWPDFSKDEFEKALVAFGCRQRRYGLVNDVSTEESYV